MAGYTNSTNDCNTSLDEEDAINRVSTDGYLSHSFFKLVLHPNLYGLSTINCQHEKICKSKQGQLNQSPQGARKHNR